MVRKLQRYQKKSRPFRRPSESVKSFPACLSPDLTQSSSPYSLVREPKLPSHFSPIVFSAYLSFSSSTGVVASALFVGVAPCQCLSFGGHQTTSPGRSSTFDWPSLCTQPKPDVTIKICPSGCVCQAERAPGSNVTLPPRTRAGSGASNRGSTRTVPVKYSSGPLP